MEGTEGGRIDIYCLHSIKTQLCILLLGFLKKKMRIEEVSVVYICIFPPLGRTFSDNNVSDAHLAVQ